VAANLIVGAAIALVLIITSVTAFNKSSKVLNYIISQAFAQLKHDSGTISYSASINYTTTSITSTTNAAAAASTNYNQSKNTTDPSINRRSSSSILANNDSEMINTTYTMEGSKDSLRTREPNLITLIIGDINKAVPIVPGTINDSVKAKATIINQITKKTQAVEGIYSVKGMTALEISRAIKTITEISNSSTKTPEYSVIIETKIGCGRSTFSSRIIECNDITRIQT
jgi:hypothetical protein